MPPSTGRQFPRPPKTRSADPWSRRLVAGNIRIAYQPYVRTVDGGLAGYEALVRLAGEPAPDDDAGWLEPDAFVSAVEDAGHGSRLTDLVCAHVLSDAADLLRGDTTVAVNVPLDVLLSAALGPMLAAALRRTGACPAQLTLELTESQPVADLDGLRAALLSLRALGMRVALDDAGPAVPLHRTLIELPFATLKLDRSMIAAVRPGAPGHADLLATIDQAHGRGLAVIAEGIEDQGTADAFRALGADMLQGFFIGRPMPLAVACAWRDRQPTAPAYTPSGPPPPA